VVGVICFATGALLDAAIGPHEGKGSNELRLLRCLDTAFLPGDVMHRRCVLLQLLSDRDTDRGGRGCAV
jgi:hypothetical protein